MGINTKAKGTAGEREVIHLFNGAGWVAFRAAGSGSSKYACPDIIAGNNIRKLAIEIKVTKEKSKYFKKQEIEELEYFSRKFGAEPYVGIKFYREPWLFITIEDLEEKQSSFGITLASAKLRGFTFEELIKS